MILRKIVISTLSMAAILNVSCDRQDSSKQEKQSDAPKQEQQVEAAPADEKALESEFAQLPKDVLMRVKLSQSGSEVAGSSEMVAVTAEEKLGSIEETFSSGSPIGAANGDDLDADSSANSWYGGNNLNQQDYQSRNVINVYQNGSTINGNQTIGVGSGNGSYNRGNGNGNGYPAYGTQGYYGSNYGYTSNYRPHNSIYHQRYRPMFGSSVRHGGWWQYSSPFCYTYGQYNYYWYPRPRCGNMNFCR
jgi:hypothetical protein